MGISGLLPMLKEAQTSIHIKEWKGKTLAVDAYVWLHRGAYGCAEQLATGKPTVSYVNYAMHRVRMLKYYGVTPLIVFDGGHLPSKMGTEGDRERKRTAALARGNSLLAEGKKSEARECFVKAVDVTPEMAYQLIKALRREGVQYVVAPYEADPQLAYLERCGLVDGVITEDSDLLVFGCRNVLFKLDGEGNCVQLRRADFTRCREFNFSDWTDVEFRQMAILSGCDYIHSIVGIGLKKAYALMRKYKTAERVVKALRIGGTHSVPRDYDQKFAQAELTFCHQRVFDPISKTLVHFQPLPDGLTSEDLPFAGGDLDLEFLRGLALGDIDPISKLPMIDINPDAFSQAAPYVSLPFRPTKPKSSQADGCQKLDNFFTRIAAPSTVKTAGGVRVAASSSTTTTNTASTTKKWVVANPLKGVSSKFFGASAKVKVEKAVAVLEDVEDPEDELELELYEALEAAEDSFDDDEAEAMRDLEMDLDVELDDEVRSDDAEAPTSPPPSFRPPCKRESSVLSVSSPPASPPAKRRCLPSVVEGREGEPIDVIDLTDDGDVSSPPASGNRCSSPPMLSPSAPRIKTEPAGLAKVTAVDGAAPTSNTRRTPSSDPIDIFSDHDERKPDVKPRIVKEVKTVPKLKPKSKAAQGAPKKQRVDTSRSLSSSEDLVEDEESSSIAAVTSAWRQQFMKQLTRSRTPSVGTSKPFQALGASSSRATPAAPIRPKLPASRRSLPLPLAKTKAHPSTALPRPPLSPKKNNSLPPPPQRRPERRDDRRAGSEDDFVEEAPKSGGSGAELTSSQERMRVTNPKLLAFQYRGPG